MPDGCARIDRRGENLTLPPERELIHALIEGLASKRNVGGLADDCAVVPFGDADLVLTIDTFSAATHFPAGLPPWNMGRFAAAATLSDLGAAGADVLGVLVGYGLARDLDLASARALAAGVAGLVEEHGGEVLGGDTKPRRELELAITALGTAPRGRAMSRRKARPGDMVVVTGPVGGAGAALARVREGLAPVEATPLTAPVPRIEAGRALRELGVRCATDLSDGLAAGASQIADASIVKLVLEQEDVPLHPWAAKRPEGLDLALNAGGDYELLATVPRELVEKAIYGLRRLGLEAATVGRVEGGRGAVLTGATGERRLGAGFEHTF